MMKGLKKLAYRIVLKDLCKCNLFIGKYDAKHGDEHFMYGVSMIMENIAYSVSDKVGDDFSDNFIKNMIASEGGEQSPSARRRIKKILKKLLTIGNQSVIINT